MVYYKYYKFKRKMFKKSESLFWLIKFEMINFVFWTKIQLWLLVEIEEENSIELSQQKYLYFLFKFLWHVNFRQISIDNKWFLSKLWKEMNRYLMSACHRRFNQGSRVSPGISPCDFFACFFFVFFLIILFFVFFCSIYF